MTQHMQEASYISGDQCVRGVSVDNSEDGVDQVFRQGDLDLQKED